MKKRILCILIAVLMCFSLTSCASKPSGGKTSGNVDTQKGKHVENLVVGTTSQPEGTSILSQEGSFGKFNYNSIAYANLFYPDKNNEMQPYFLKNYSISKNGKKLNMTFPTNAVWHDGKPVTVDDMVFTFKYRRDVMQSKSLENLKDIKVNGKDSITLIFSEPDAYYYVKNSGNTTFVIPKHIWENIKDYSAYTGEDAAIGCGPYKLTGVDKDAGTMKFEAVPQNAFLGDLTVDSITLKSYSTQDALLMALANGEIDVIYDYASPINYTLLDVIKGKKNINLGESKYTGCNQVTFGMGNAPNTDHAFREATVKSLDWDLLRKLCNGKYGKIPGSGIIPPSCTGHDASLWKMYRDINEAKGILDKAGYKDVDGDGFRELPDGSKLKYKVTAQYTTKKQELFNRIGEVIVTSLKDVGINAYFDQESLVSDEANEKMVKSNNYDMFIGYTTSGVASYRTAFWYFLPRDIAGKGGMEWGNSYNNENLNNTYNSLMNASNNNEYLEAVGNLQKLASKDLFAFAVCWEKCFFPYRTDKYTGFENYPSVGVVHAETFYNLKTK